MPTFNIFISRLISNSNFKDNFIPFSGTGRLSSTLARRRIKKKPFMKQNLSVSVVCVKMQKWKLCFSAKKWRRALLRILIIMVAGYIFTYLMLSHISWYINVVKKIVCLHKISQTAAWSGRTVMSLTYYLSGSLSTIHFIYLSNLFRLW